MNTDTQTVSIHSTVFDRRALNLDVESLASAVKPWFDGLIDTETAQTITELKIPETHLEAAKFLGLGLIPVTWDARLSAEDFVPDTSSYLRESAFSAT